MTYPLFFQLPANCYFGKTSMIRDSLLFWVVFSFTSLARHGFSHAWTIKLSTSFLCWAENVLEGQSWHMHWTLLNLFLHDSVVSAWSSGTGCGLAPLFILCWLCAWDLISEILVCMQGACCDFHCFAWGVCPGLERYYFVVIQSWLCITWNPCSFSHLCAEPHYTVVVFGTVSLRGYMVSSM